MKYHRGIYFWRRF